MKTTIQRWGNSLGIRIPSSIIKKLSLHPGIILEIAVEDNHITLYPKKYSLSDMVSQITDENRHNLEWEGNDSRGAEEW